MRLDCLDGGHHVVLEAAAGRARDQGRALVADGERLEDLVGDPHLLPRIRGGERYADGVPDALAQQDPYAHGAADAAGFDWTRFCDSEVDRIRARGGELAVRHDVGPHVGRLQRDLDEARTVVEVFEDLAVAERHLDHAVSGLLAIVAVDGMVLAHALVHLFGSDPALTPIRNGICRSLAAVTTLMTLSRSGMLPGFSRRQCTPASIASSARVWS